MAMDRTTGKTISDYAHTLQSIQDILTTPVGSRVYVREYGSRLFELLDSPVTEGLITAILQATVEAISKWEPRVKVNRTIVNVDDYAKGILFIDVYGLYLPNGRAIRLEGIKIQR